jgi:hypothetical protein
MALIMVMTLRPRHIETLTKPRDQMQPSLDRVPDGMDADTTVGAQ